MPPDDEPLDRSGDADADEQPLTLSRVPNQPKTPHHSFRVSDELWEAAKHKAAERGETVADILRDFLREYVDDEEDSES